jgi:hypothetical protein
MLDTDIRQTAVIDRDLPCRRCQYNLRTLPADGRCPECGEPVSASSQYRAPDARWLRAQARGCCLLVAGNALLIAGMATSAWGPFKELTIPLAIGVGGFRAWLLGVSRQLVGLGTAAEAFPISLSLAGVALAVAGTLQIARRESGEPEPPRTKVLRLGLTLTGLFAALVTMCMLAAAAGLGTGRGARTFEMGDEGVWCVASVDPPHVCLLFLRLAHVAGRLGRPPLRRALLAAGAAVACTGAYVVLAPLFGRATFPSDWGGLITSGFYPFAAAGAASIAAILALARAASRAGR